MSTQVGFLTMFWRVFKTILIGFLVILSVGIVLSGAIGVTGGFHTKVLFKALIAVGIVWAFLYWLENVIYHVIGMQSREIKDRLASTESRVIDANRDLREIKQILNEIQKK